MKTSPAAPSRSSGGRDQSQNDWAGGARRCRARPARQAEMGRAVARARMPEMPAERDLLPLLVAAIRVAAVAWFELQQRDQPRPNTDAAQFHRFDGLEGRLRR